MSNNKSKKVKNFSEVQLVANKDMIENLEMQLEEMYQIAEDNFALIQKIINFDHELMACKTVKQVLKVVDKSFKQFFNLANNVLKLSVEPKGKTRVSDDEQITDESLVQAIKGLDKAITGTQCMHADLYTWFAEDVKVESFLHLPLIANGKHLGLLLVGHESPDYFAENVPTDYVEMMSKSVAITLNRIIGGR